MIRGKGGEGETLQRPAVIAAVSGGDNDNRRTIIKKVNIVKTFLIRISSLIMKVLTVTDCISTSSYDKIIPSSDFCNTSRPLGLNQSIQLSTVCQSCDKNLKIQIGDVTVTLSLLSEMN